MSHRTQITLTDREYTILKRESERTGLSLAELVRRALGTTYAVMTADEARHTLDDSFGAWSQRDFDGETYVENIRRGLAGRLSQ